MESAPWPHLQANSDTSNKLGHADVPAMLHILLVEDHTDTRTVLGMLLNRCGCQTVTAKNLRDARQRLEEMRFDALISD